MKIIMCLTKYICTNRLGNIDDHAGVKFFQSCSIEYYHFPIEVVEIRSRRSLLAIYGQDTLFFQNLFSAIVFKTLLYKISPHVRKLRFR